MRSFDGARSRTVALVLGAGLLATLIVAALLSRPDAAHSVDPPTPASTTFAALRGGAPLATLGTTQAQLVDKVAAGSTPIIRAGAATKGARTYLAQSGPAVCLVTDVGGGVGPVSCSSDSTAFATEDLNALVTIAADGYVVSGAAPDGVHDVALTTKGGSLPVQITNNTFVVKLSAAPARVDWVDGNGTKGTYAFVNPDITLERTS